MIGIDNLRCVLRPAIAAAIGLVLVALAGLTAPTTCLAQGGACTQACQSAYAQCYRTSGSNRKACEAELQQCLARCIDKR